MKKLKETQSPLIHRTQVEFETEHFQKSTPKKVDVIKSIASNLKVAEDLIHVKKIIARFGSTKSKIIADIYKSKEDFKKYAKIGKKEKTQEAPKEEVKSKEEVKEVKEDGKEKTN